MQKNTVARRVIRTSGVMYEFEITLLSDEPTYEQLAACREVLITIANQVIKEHDMIIPSQDKLEALRSVVCAEMTPNVVVRLRMASLRDVPEDLLAMMGDTVVRAFGLLVDIAAGVVELAGLGIVDAPQHIRALGAVNVVDHSGDGADAATAMFDAFVKAAMESGAFTASAGDVPE